MRNKLVKCPKCGEQNDTSTETCKDCGINLQWAIEHWDHYVSGPEEGYPPLILASDDSPTMMDLIRFTLERAGYRVATEENALETLTLAEHLLPDLITTDFMKPVMDGAEMICRLKSNPVLKDIPVLVISAGALEERGPVAIAVGATKYLCKPVPPRDLVSTVASILDK